MSPVNFGRNLGAKLWGEPLSWHKFLGHTCSNLSFLPVSPGDEGSWAGGDVAPCPRKFGALFLVRTKILRQEGPGTTIGNSLDPQHPRFWPTSPIHRQLPKEHQTCTRSALFDSGYFLLPFEFF